jgi:homoserine O-acetyltransferase
MTSIKSSFGSQFKEYNVGEIVKLATKKPLKLTSGVKIDNFNVAYQTYGKLNKDKSNAILICHPITGDQYVASKHPVTQKEGWWNFMIGKDKPIDTNKYFVICSNVIGGCLGSFGPKDINDKTKQTYSTDFPFITIEDMVKAQKLLLEHFKIKTLVAIIGGSMGGMLALTFASLYPKITKAIIPISTSFKNSVQNIAFNEVGRQAIMADPDWCNGKYFEENKYPQKGLAVARMTAHITYLSKKSLHEKFGRNLQDKKQLSYGFEVDFQIESYLRYQGLNFVKRFDPNSYLYLTKAVDYFDLEAENNGILSNAFKDCTAKFCVISFSDDWLFTPEESRKLAQALNIVGNNVSLINIQGNAGHDSFLIENDSLKNTVKGFLSSIAQE